MSVTKIKTIQVTATKKTIDLDSYKPIAFTVENTGGVAAVIEEYLSLPVGSSRPFDVKRHPYAGKLSVSFASGSNPQLTVILFIEE